MFNSVKLNRASENIVEQIRKAILERQLNPGDRLPPERELMINFGVSKSTLREALRALEALGVLEIRQGASGGPFITEVDMNKAIDSFANFLHFKNISLRDLTEVRLVLEPYIAERAALSIVDEDLKRLEQSLKDSENVLKQGAEIDLRKYEIEFHKIIASIGSNPILMFIVDFVEELLINTKEILQPGPTFSRQVQNAHKRIYRALAEKDAGKARKEMVRHIQEVEKDLLTLQKQRGLEELSLQRPIRGYMARPQMAK
jgi:GntR family transcriptional repressor for pyruvate dehydrogenase complex